MLKKIALVDDSLTTKLVFALIMAKTGLTHHQVRSQREKMEYRLLLEVLRKSTSSRIYYVVLSPPVHGTDRISTCPIPKKIVAGKSSNFFSVHQKQPVNSFSLSLVNKKRIVVSLTIFECSPKIQKNA